MLDRGRVSKETFEDPEFRAMNQGFYEAGGGSGEAPYVAKKGLKAYVTAEWSIFKVFARFMLDRLLEYSKGNPPCQGLNDCATLKNQHKCIAGGVEFIDPELRENHALAVCMLPITGDTDAIVAAKLDEAFIDVLALSYQEVCNQTESDAAALGVARQFGHDELICDMHSVDKIPRAMLGDLVRSKGKVVLNPFPEAQVLMGKLHKAAVYFSYSTRWDKLMAFRSVVPGGFAKVRPKTDHNTTRVSSRRSLVFSLVRLHKGLDLYASANSSNWSISKEQWETTAELLALMDIPAKVATLSQTESKYTTALGVPLKEQMMEKFRAESIDVVDLPSVSESAVLPLLRKSVADFTEVGEEARRRGTLEGERRYCANATEVLTGVRRSFIQTATSSQPSWTRERATACTSRAARGSRRS